MTDLRDALADIRGERPADAAKLDWEKVNYRKLLALIAEEGGEWAGIPYPLDGFRLRVAHGYPFKQVLDPIGDDTRIGAEVDGPVPEDDETFIVRRAWWSWAKKAWVWFYREGTDPRLRCYVEKTAPAMERLTLSLTTLGASNAWDVEAELEAQRKLLGLLSEVQQRHYQLTGTFLETSPRSRVTYFFRRGRPTVAIVPGDRNDDSRGMHCLAVLCLHPIGLYSCLTANYGEGGGTWAGAMCPSDDVIAHLLMIRGDEAFFWRKANQHHLESAAAGL